MNILGPIPTFIPGPLQQGCGKLEFPDLTNYKWVSIWHNCPEIAFISALFFFFLFHSDTNKTLLSGYFTFQINQISICGVINQAQLKYYVYGII